MTNQNWFSGNADRPVLTKYVYAPGGTTSPFKVESHTNLLYVNIEKAVAANYDLVGAHAGATWTAPEGEQVKSITFTYGAVLSANLNLTVYGGTSADSFGTEIGRVVPEKMMDNRTAASWATVTFTVPEGASISNLQIRALEIANTTALGSGWYNQIRNITIKTEPKVP